LNELKIWLKRIVHHTFFGPSLVILFVLFANFLYLSNVFVANPTDLRSGLINSGQPGPQQGQYTIDPSDGFYAQSLGHRAAVDLAKGHLPWWNPYEGIGTPLVGGLQSGALFPLEFLLVFGNGLFYFHLMLEIIAGLGVYYLLKRLKCNEVASVIGAAAFGVNGTYAWIAHTIVNPVAFLPLLLLGVEFILDSTRKSKKRGWLLLALAVACTMYAGFPETGFIDILFVSLWAVVRMTTLKRSAYRSYITKLIGAGLLGIALASPLLLAFKEYLPYANVGLHAGNTSHLVLPKIGLAGLILPYIYGPIFANWPYDKTLTLYDWWAVVGGFLSISLLVPAIVGIAAPVFRRLDRYFLLGWIVFCILASYGLLRFNEIAGHIPLLSSAAFSRYFPPTYELAIVMLAAMGLTFIWQHVDKKKKVLKPIVIATLVCLVAIIGAALLGWNEYQRLLHAHAPDITFYYRGSIIWALSMVVLLGLFLSLSGKKFFRGCVIFLILLDVGGMYAIPMFSAPRKATIDLQPVKYLRANLGYQRIYSLGPIQPNYGSFYRVAEVNINDVPQPKAYSNYITKDLDSNVNPITFTGSNTANANGIQPNDAFLKNIQNYEAIGVKYVITFPGTFSAVEVQQQHMTLAYHDAISYIWQLPTTKPYISTLSGACVTQVIGWNQVSANCSKQSVLLRLEQYFPGWSAKVDNSSKAIGSYQGLFQTVKVPAGHHTVSFYFEPPHVKLTYILVTAGLVVIVVEYCAPDLVHKNLKKIAKSKALNDLFFK
jgi:hypothetical protein